MSITARRDKNGKLRYRAEIRKRVSGYPAYSESKTFSSKAVAESWRRKRLLEIETNPDIMLGLQDKDMTLASAIERFLNEYGENYGRTVNKGLLAIKGMPIAKTPVSKITRGIVTKHAQDRRNGRIDGYDPVAGATIKHELSLIRNTLNQAELSWGCNVNLHEFDRAVEGLRRARVVKSSGVRERLFTKAELDTLTHYFIDLWYESSRTQPLHLIMWFALYTTRRLSEITRMRIEDFDRVNMQWLIRDVKSPHGSKGNHKLARVPDQVLPIIDLLLEKDTRNRMLKNGGDLSFIIPLNPKTIGKDFREARYLTGLDDGSVFHMLRHEGITRLAEDGYSIPQIQRVSLHSSWSSLQRYDNVQKRGERAEWADYVEYLDNVRLKHGR